jgi:hypothetical protein
MTRLMGTTSIHKDGLEGNFPAGTFLAVVIRRARLLGRLEEHRRPQALRLEGGSLAQLGASRVATGCAEVRGFAFKPGSGSVLVRNFFTNAQDEKKKSGQGEEYGDCGSHGVTSFNLS